MFSNSELLLVALWIDHERQLLLFVHELANPNYSYPF